MLSGRGRLFTAWNYLSGSFSRRNMSQTLALPASTLQEEEPQEINVLDSSTGTPSVIVTRKRHPSPAPHPPPRKRRGKATADVVDLENIRHINYYFENGLRKVAPYYFTFTAHAKERWFGRTLGDVFATEFFAVNEEVVHARLESPTLFANGVKVTKEHRIKNGDFIAHYMHRHEMPVSAQPIRIIAETAELLVVDKPASIPAHPCGRFRLNTLMYILAKEKGLNNLRLINRLDRLTSGLMILAKTPAASLRLSLLLRDHSIRKTYLARVRGAFPSTPLTCQAPIETVNPRAALNRVVAGSPRFCSTHFRRLSHDPVSDTSLVQCEPLTGRTHQIRVHLQHLGHPIPNDPMYGPDAPLFGEHGEVPGEEDAEDLERDEGLKGVKYARRERLPETEWADAECPECWIEFVDPPADLRIDLHAWKYAGPGFEYQTELPEWAASLLTAEAAPEAGGVATDAV
ncbi:uncharacterized protein LOC129594057 [Paramacrobiotus metropolitanus]|uniref:uncharacterized protein LOC129594057 n=1 Tax=Paramacrobiotus metropolitanus TaxID=2943436 RepID=UPI002445F749|nr:uncharacterized protein LOC129594057 [Paramacrobiotus metropolitanus]